LRRECAGLALEALGRRDDVLLETTCLLVTLVMTLGITHPGYGLPKFFVDIVLVRGTHD
jgi:hypothetical protein